MSERFSKFFKRIRQTQVEEIDCSECLDGVSQYVDLELAHRDAAARMPRVWHHLEQCGVCHEEYQILLDLAGMEQAGELPPVDDLKKRLDGI
jgi:hypothetical protein